MYHEVCAGAAFGDAARAMSIRASKQAPLCTLPEQMLAKSKGTDQPALQAKITAKKNKQAFEVVGDVIF